MQTKNIFRIAIFFSIIILGNGCIAQQSGPQVTKDFNISNFEILHLETIGKVIYEQSSSAYLTVEGGENLVDKIRATSDGNRLSIVFEPNRKIHNKSNLVYKIGSPVLTQLDYNGVGKLSFNDGFKGSSLHINHEGVGNLSIENCTLDNFRLDFNAVGSCKITGTTNSTFIDADGVGSIDCSNLKSNFTTVKSDGVGSISVHAEKEIEISASGVGNVTYSGNPDNVKTETSGVGKIKEKK